MLATALRQILQVGMISLLVFIEDLKLIVRSLFVCLAVARELKAKDSI